MINQKEFQKGKLYFYSDFYDKSYAIIRADKITKRKQSHFWFNAIIVDNSHLDSKDKPWQANGTLHSYSNSFIYNSLDDLKKGSERYKQVQVKALKAFLR